MRTTRLLGLTTLTLTFLLTAPGAVRAQSPVAAAPQVETTPHHGIGVVAPERLLESATQQRRAARLAEQEWLRPSGHVLANTPADVADGFESSGFAQFMSSKAGRLLRVVAGAGMIAGGIAADSDLGTGIAIAGAVPLLAGTFDFCVLSPLFGGPLSGKAIRAAGK
jgi:hypothetical protein